LGQFFGALAFERRQLMVQTEVNVGLFAGAGAFFEGMAFVVATPRVWPRAMVPMLVALVLFVGAGWLGFLGALALAHRLVQAGLGATLLTVIFAVPALLLALVLALSLAQPLSGWALDGIVRAQRQAIGLPPLPEGSLSAAMLSSFVATLLALAVGVPLVAALTLVGWFFPPAAIATVPLKFLVGALLVAWNLVDYPMAMQGHPLGARLRWACQHWRAFLGFGLAATCFFAVPGLGLLALPCGVAGAARLTG
jgi:CysZ protein